jgi:hypothetical protein
MSHIKLECLKCKSLNQIDGEDFADDEAEANESQMAVETSGESDRYTEDMGVIYRKQITIDSTCGNCGELIQVERLTRKDPDGTDTLEYMKVSGATIVENAL